MTTDQTISFEDFREQWLEDIRGGSPSTVELGHRFAHKILTQWLDINGSSNDLVYCDGSGDGGIDIAYLDRGDIGEEESAAAVGDIWYIVQSKYGRAFQGATTMLEEGQKVIDTLDGKRRRLSSLAEGLLERLMNFRAQASEQDRIMLVFATENPLDDDQNRALRDVKAMARERLGPLVDVLSVSIETIYRRTLEQADLGRVRVPIRGKMAQSADDLLVGAVTLTDLFEFLKAYKEETNDLDQLYERNLRRFLGGRGKINKAIQETLRVAPERFGLYNNGITIVVTDFQYKGDGILELVEPYVVNGCQTTRTVWEVCYQRLETGGHGVSPELEDWKARLDKGVVVTKIARVGAEGGTLERAITRYTNSQNAVREKDFLALTNDFRAWAQQMEDRYELFLETQRGGWDSRRALQKQRPDLKQFREAANAFDLIKVYGAGWMGEPGLAFGKNAPFLPNGTIFKRITEQFDSETDPFGVEDLYAAYLLQKAADEKRFGRGARGTRRQTRFLFYMVVLDLLSDVLTRMERQPTNKAKTQALIRVFTLRQEVREAFLESALEVVDSYLTQGTDNCIHDEPAFGSFNHDLNAFLKWDKLGKSEENSPRLRTQLAVAKTVMGQKHGECPSVREQAIAALTS